MENVGILSGNAPVIKKFQVAASVTVLGIPLLTPAAGGAGLALPTTTAINDMVGCNIDLATFATAQQTDGSSPEALITCIINPDAIWRIGMSGGAAADTAESTRTENTGSATGLVVTTGDDWSSPTNDEGSVWCTEGANKGQLRKSTSVSSSAATVTVAFQNDIAIGDIFSWAPVFPMTTQTITLTSDFSQFRQDVAVATNTAEFTCIELHPNDWLNANRGPFGLFVANDHILKRES